MRDVTKEALQGAERITASDELTVNEIMAIRSIWEHTGVHSGICTAYYMGYNVASKPKAADEAIDGERVRRLLILQRELDALDVCGDLIRQFPDLHDMMTIIRDKRDEVTEEFKQIEAALGL